MRSFELWEQLQFCTVEISNIPSVEHVTFETAQTSSRSNLEQFNLESWRNESIANVTLLLIETSHITRRNGHPTDSTLVPWKRGYRNINYRVFNASDWRWLTKRFGQRRGASTKRWRILQKRTNEIKGRQRKIMRISSSRGQVNVPIRTPCRHELPAREYRKIRKSECRI